MFPRSLSLLLKKSCYELILNLRNLELNLEILEFYVVFYFIDSNTYEKAKPLNT
jgi:hypothetical protein